MFHYVTSNFKYYHFDKNQFEIIVKQLSENKKIIGLKQFKKIQKCRNFSSEIAAAKGLQ